MLSINIPNLGAVAVPVEMNQVEGTWEISDRVKNGAVIEYVDPKSTLRVFKIKSPP